VLIDQSRAMRLGIRKKSSAWDLELKIIIIVEVSVNNPTAIEGSLRTLRA
jgi:hypothetical protein